MDTEDRLYQEYLAGDQSALEKLMERYGDRLTLYINGYVDNLHDAEDLLIEVFAYLVDKRPRIKSSFHAYVYKAARNYALMFLKKQKRHLFFSQEEMEFHLESTADDSAEFVLSKKERNKTLYQCMKRLSNAQREAMYLVYIEDMSYQEVAQTMHKTVKQIDKLLQLGKKKMRPLLEKESIHGAFHG